MEITTDSRLLDVWEQAKGTAPAQRDAVILAATQADQAIAQFMQMSVGRSDTGLMQLYRRLFGDRMDGLATCPDCGQDLEFGFSLADVHLPAEDATPEMRPVEEKGYMVHFRLPTASDLDAASSCETAEAAQFQLLESCVLSAEYQGERIPVNKLPDDLLASIDQAMEAADPQGAVSLAVQCAVCHHQWRTPFNVSLFLWQALDAWGWRTLNEIHQLALAYGWSETEILAVCPWRRQYYLSMVQA